MMKKITLFVLLCWTASASGKLLDKKLVLAHFMTGDIQRTIINGQSFNGVSADYDDYRKDGKYAAIGGLNQALPFYLMMDKNKTVPLREVVEKELKAAHKYGIDGFHFYYPLHRHDSFMKRYNAIITMFFTVANEKYPDFKMTLCLCNPSGGNQVEKISLWSYHIRKLIKATESSPNWLKTSDGRYLFYLWCQDGLADAVKDQHWLVNRFPERITQVAEAYQELANAIGIKAAYMYDIRFPENEQLVDEAIQHFDGTWSWTDNLQALPYLEKVITKSKKANKTFCLSVYPDYYTGKLYNKKPPYKWQQISPQRAQELNPQNYSRHYQNCGLSKVYRELFEFALKHDLPVISITSWNDYPEGHHIAPEANHNFAPAVLLEYYKNLWLKKSHETPESVSVFYKKYQSHIKAKYHFDLHTKLAAGPSSLEDDIEIVTLLKDAADVYLNGVYIGRAQAGITSLRAESKPGKVTVQVLRGEDKKLELSAPEWITDKPYRTDRFTYMFSSRFDEFYTDIFGNSQKAPALKEYVND